MSRSLRKIILLCLLWLALLACAAMVDRQVARALHDGGWNDAFHLRGKNAAGTSAHPASVVLATVAAVVKAPGNFLFTLALAATVSLLHLRKWLAGAWLCLCGMAAGLTYWVVKWLVGRTRPFPRGGVALDSHLHPCNGGLYGLFHANNQAFPSGHACLAFATAAGLAIIFPRWRVLFYAAAMIVATERVLEGAHYPADIVGGAGLGIISAYAVAWLGHRLFPQDDAMLGRQDPPNQVRF